jgi:thiamine kinase-like enzyme
MSSNSQHNVKYRRRNDSAAVPDSEAAHSQKRTVAGEPDRSNSDTSSTCSSATLWWTTRILVLGFGAWSMWKMLLPGTSTVVSDHDNVLLHDLRTILTQSNIDIGMITSVTVVTGGLSNRNFRVVIDGGRSFMVRVPGDYGQPEEIGYSAVHMIDRRVEAAVGIAAEHANLAPRAVARNLNTGVFVTTFMDHARTLQARDLQDTAYLQGVVSMLYKLHTEGEPWHGSQSTELLTEPDSKFLFPSISQVPVVTPYQRAVRRFDFVRALKSLAKTTDSEQHTAHPELPKSVYQVLEKVRVLEDLIGTATMALRHPDFSTKSRRICALHGDPAPANFLDDGKRLWMVDFEYSVFGDRFYDVANLCALNNLAEPYESQVLDSYASLVRKSNGWQAMDLDADPMWSDSFIKARHFLMKATLNTQEGSWAIVQHYTSDLKFDAEWSSHDNYLDYGLEFLHRVAAELDLPVAAQHVHTILGAIPSAVISKHLRQDLDRLFSKSTSG